MNIKINKAEIKIFQKAITSIANLSGEVGLEFNKNEMLLKGFDTSNIAVFDLKIKNGFFSEYVLDKDVKIFINLTDFSKILKKAKSEIILSFNEKDNFLEVKTGKDEWQITLIDNSYDTKKLPELNNTGCFEYSVEKLGEVLENALICSEDVCFVSDKKSINVYSKGTLNKFNTTLEDVEIETQIKGKYNIEYINKFLIDDFETCKISMDNETPMELKYDIGNLELRFILAPKSMEE